MVQKNIKVEIKEKFTISLPEGREKLFAFIHYSASLLYMKLHYFPYTLNLS
jgi:hypothetical protein